MANPRGLLTNDVRQVSMGCFIAGWNDSWPESVDGDVAGPEAAGAAADPHADSAIIAATTIMRALRRRHET